MKQIPLKFTTCPRALYGGNILELTMIHKMQPWLIHTNKSQC